MKPNFSDEELLNEIRYHLELKNRAISELDKLNIALIKLNNQLNNAESLKSNFLANIRNELFNPLTSILAITKNILKSKEKIEKNEIIKLIEYIDAECFYLNFQLKNIVSAATIEAGDMNLQISEIDLISLIEDLIKDFKFFLNKKNLSISLENNITTEKITTDPEKIQVILSNILDNAIKFSYENKKIILKINKEDEYFCINVINFGKGILEEEKDKVFDRFWKEDNSINSINKGLGLGLSITKAYTEFLGGKIEIKNIPALETEIKITIPNLNKNNLQQTFDLNTFLF